MQGSAVSAPTRVAVDAAKSLTIYALVLIEAAVGLIGANAGVDVELQAAAEQLKQIELQLMIAQALTRAFRRIGKRGIAVHDRLCLITLTRLAIYVFLLDRLHGKLHLQERNAVGLKR